MINLKNDMEVFVYFAISVARAGGFIDIVTYCNLRKSTVFFNPSILSQISMIDISVDGSGVGEGKQRGDLPLITIANNRINERTSGRYTQFSALVCDCSIIYLVRYFVYTSILKFRGV